MLEFWQLQSGKKLGRFELRRKFSLRNAMNKNLFCLPVLLIIGLVPTVHAESDAFAELSFTGLFITPNAGTVSLTSLQAITFGQIGATSQSASGTTPSVDLTGTFSTADASASTPGTLALSVSGTASANSQIPASDIGVDNALGSAAVNGQFMIIGGTGSVSTTFNIPFFGLLVGFTDGAGLSSTAETLLNLQLDGNPILTDDRPASIPANGNYGQTYTTSLQQIVSLNYNQLYTFDLEAQGMTTVNNVPEPHPSIILICGLALLALRGWRTHRLLEIFASFTGRAKV
jgi:hypothetical protein